MSKKDKNTDFCTPLVVNVPPKTTISVNELDWKILTAEEHARRRNPAYKYIL